MITALLLFNRERWGAASSNRCRPFSITGGSVRGKDIIGVVRAAVAVVVLPLCVHSETAAHGVDAQANASISLDGSNLCSAVLATVNGKPLTAAAVKDAVLVLSRARDLTAGIRKGRTPEGRQANSLAMRITPQLLSSMLVEDELDRRAIMANAESDASVLEGYNRKFKSDAKTPDELAALFGELAPSFRQQFSRESRCRAMFATLPELAVTNDDIVKFYAAVSNKMALSANINRSASNRIEQAWRELEGGRPWEVVATNYTEDAIVDESLADNWKEWMSLKLSKIEPMDLMVAVSKLKPGGYTKPIDIDEGLVIAKLVERDEDFCSLARILVRMAAEVEVPPRDAAVRKIRKGKEAEFQRKLLHELKAKAKIEYPYGRKFVLKIWEEPLTDKRKPGGDRRK